MATAHFRMDSTLDAAHAGQARAALAAFLRAAPPPPKDASPYQCEQARKACALAGWFQFAINELGDSGGIVNEALMAAFAGPIGNMLAGAPPPLRPAILAELVSRSMHAAAQAVVEKRP